MSLERLSVENNMYDSNYPSRGGNVDGTVKLVIYGVLALLALFILFTIWPFAQVGQTQRGVVLRNGAFTRVMEPGLHFRAPLLESVIVMDVSAVKNEAEASAASKDLQNASTKVAINYTVNPADVEDLYTKYENDHASRLINPAIQEAVKSATAKYTAEELVTKREAVKSDITSSLKNTLSPYGIEVTEVFITDFAFSQEFNNAIEAKVTAEQNALAEKNNLQAAQYKAQAIKVTADAANNDRYIALQQLDVQKAAIEKWDGHLPNQMVPGQTLPFLQLNANK